MTSLQDNKSTSSLKVRYTPEGYCQNFALTTPLISLNGNFRAVANNSDQLPTHPVFPEPLSNTNFTWRHWIVTSLNVDHCGCARRVRLPMTISENSHFKEWNSQSDSYVHAVVLYRQFSLVWRWRSLAHEKLNIFKDKRLFHLGISSCESTKWEPRFHSNFYDLNICLGCIS